MTANKIEVEQLGISNVGEFVAVAGRASNLRTLLVGVLEAVTHGVRDSGHVGTVLHVKLNGVDEPIRGSFNGGKIWVGDDLVEVTRSVIDDLESQDRG
ncbi:hypothetical protein [Gordonia rubripertincta]|uniref:hypothetical protein n=1 Tax=Gordonia rubripertincta TaxID=36822 RepID=UPI0015FC250D|nr:hypothetical protein [Gordonia rubripertincta]QMU22044.1 hypothetical protein H3V45_06015 [Gordonia rubripertincta]